MANNEIIFPDPEAAKAKGKEKEPEFEIEVEGEEAEKPKKKAKEKEKKEDLELEIVDDTPEKDRGRKASAPPEELTDEELDTYQSEKIKKRIKHFDKAYHDERRAKEEALREREELQKVAKALLEEREQLKGAVSKNQTTLLDQAKQTVVAELDVARKEYEEAYETGDGKKVLAAQEKLVQAKIKADRVNNFKLPPLQEKKAPVKDEPSAPAVDQKAVAWAKRNPWFHHDEEMTGFAFGLHNKLVASGVDPKSDEYYTKLDSRMRQVFANRFATDDDDNDDTPPPKRKADTVAPASRSTAPKKIRLTKSQVAVAKRLGVSLEDYARQMVALETAERNS